MSDELMDERLAAAGAAWRVQHASAQPAAAVIAAARVLDEPAAGSSARTAIARRRPRAWIAGAIAVAAMAAALVVALARLGPSDRAQPTPPADPSDLYGVIWHNSSSSFTWPSGTHHASGFNSPPFRLPRPVVLQFRRGGTVVGSDGCNTFRAETAIAGNRMTISNIVRTTASCAGRQVRDNAVVIDTLLSGTVRWSIPCGELHLVKPGRGDLEYRPARFPESNVRCLYRWSKAHSGH